MKKETKIQLIIILILTIILGVVMFFTINEINTKRIGIERKNPMEEENTAKETTANDVEEGTTVKSNQIDLSKYNTNITITEAGEYTLSGSTKNSVLVNTTDKVTLILKNVDIQSKKTAAIANISENDLIIKIENDTENKLSDGGSSEYDSCIYSKGNLIIEGDGILNVFGNQEEGEGIATETKDITINSGTINIECQDDGLNAGGDGGLITVNGGNIYIKASGDGIDSNKKLIINGGNIYTIGSSLGGDAGIDTNEGFEINGGDVIALGSDMLQNPEKTSKQSYICFSLNNKINEGTEVSIKDETENEIVSFEAKENFKTLIISNSKIFSGTYYLYTNNEKTKYNQVVK